MYWAKPRPVATPTVTQSTSNPNPIPSRAKELAVIKWWIDAGAKKDDKLKDLTIPDDLKSTVCSNPEIMGGTPVFSGTRVPLQNLIDALEGGESIDEFLEGFPSVKRAQVIAVIEAGKFKMLELV